MEVFDLHDRKESHAYMVDLHVLLLVREMNYISKTSVPVYPKYSTAFRIHIFYLLINNYVC